jgi:hypothetical protein
MRAIKRSGAWHFWQTVSIPKTLRKSSDQRMYFGVFLGLICSGSGAATGVARSTQVVKMNRIRYLDRNSAAFGEIADRHFSRIRSSLGDRARVIKSRRTSGMDL